MPLPCHFQKFLFLGLLSEQRVRDTVGDFRLAFGYHVRVERFCRCHGGMTQLPRHRHNIRSLRNQNRSRRVPECMGVDMREAVALGKVGKPCGYTVWADWQPPVCEAFFFCRRPADCYLLSKKESITAFLSACYRLCVWLFNNCCVKLFYTN